MTVPYQPGTDELERLARICIDTCFRVRPGEQVLVVTDETNTEAGAALAEAATTAKGIAHILLLPKRDKFETQPPQDVVEAMVRSSVVILALDHELSVPFSHSVGCRQALAAGARMGLFWATEDSAQVSASDVSELRELTERLAELMRTTSVVRCTSAGGTDVVVPIGGRRVTAFYSIIDRPGAICTIPYYAEAATAPVEGGTEGIIVVDTYMHWLGQITSPIALHVEGGRVVDVTGGPQSSRLKEIIAGADDNATNIAELGIGTCRIGAVRGTSQDKALIGTAHLGIGHNHSLGGSVISNVHLDGVFKDATLTFDGKVIMRAGRFML